MLRCEHSNAAPAEAASSQRRRSESSRSADLLSRRHRLSPRLDARRSRAVSDASLQRRGAALAVLLPLAASSTAHVVSNHGIVPRCTTCFADCLQRVCLLFSCVLFPQLGAMGGGFPGAGAVSGRSRTVMGCGPPRGWCLAHAAGCRLRAATQCCGCVVHRSALHTVAHPSPPCALFSMCVHSCRPVPTLATTVSLLLLPAASSLSCILLRA